MPPLSTILFWLPQTLLGTAFVLLFSAQERLMIGSFPWYPLDLLSIAFFLASLALLFFRRYHHQATPFAGHWIVFGGVFVSNCGSA